ncbi:MAG: hypothetical protein LBU97_03505 [Alistipes sp.]|nr:hypothetical protein [Alistipes sp.]
MTYNRDVSYHFWEGFHGMTTRCLGVDFISVEVVSDAHFDETHPVGESLGNVVMFKSGSCKPYIDRGYMGEKYIPIEMPVSELEPENLILLGNQFNDIALLEFDREPTLSKMHNITVTMTADDGRVFSDTIEVVFE